MQTMHDDSPLKQMIQALRELLQEDRDGETTLGTLLWLMTSSEHCHRTLRAARPSAEALEALCRRLGDPARAWIQFSPAACELLNGPPRDPLAELVAESRLDRNAVEPAS